MFKSTAPIGIRRALPFNRSMPLAELIVMFNRSVVAWIERRAENEYEGAFVAAAVDRQPATKVYASAGSARHWIEREAEAIAASVEWLEAAPPRQETEIATLLHRV